MKRAMINPDKCQSCEVCRIEQQCSESDVIIRESAEDMPWVDFYKCRGCMKCKTYCLHGAVEELTQPCDMTRKMSW